MNALRRYFQPEQLRALILVLLILLMILFFGSQIPNYVSGRTFNRISTSVAVIALVAVAQTLVLITRNVDLSLGSIVGVTAYVVGTYLTRHQQTGPLVAVAMCIGIGVIAGSINGLLVAYGRVPAIIATLGTLALFRTFLVEISHAKTVVSHELPKWAQTLPQMSAFKIGDLDFRLMVVVSLAVVLMFHLIVTYLPVGRRLYAIGSNPDAARVAGFPAKRITFLAFVLSGGLAGMAGFAFMARFGNITVVAGQGMELQSVAAAVVGGASTSGGIGTMFGALLGSILIDLLDQSLIRWLAISEFWRDALLGALILGFVAVDAIVIERLRKIWARNDLQLSRAPDAPAIGDAEGVPHAR